jgi:hypothetical protein
MHGAMPRKHHGATTDTTTTAATDDHGDLPARHGAYE